MASLRTALQVVSMMVLVISVHGVPGPVEPDTSHPDEFHHAKGWTEEGKLKKANVNHDKFEYPNTVGSNNLCESSSCTVEVTVSAEHEAETADEGMTPLIEGQFVMVLNKGPEVDVPMGDDLVRHVHWTVEVEDDPFRCGRNPVDLYQGVQDGALRGFTFHKDETDLSKRYKQGMLTALAIFQTREAIKLSDGKPVDEKRLALLQDSELAEFSFTEAKKLSNGFHRKWHVRITNAEHQLPKKPITELVELLDM